MKKTMLLAVCCLLLSVAAFAAAPATLPAAGSEAPTVGAAPSDDALDAILGAPAPVDLYTYITWSGGTCTAWMFCPGEPYWKCQSTTGNCQVTACSMTCNGLTRTCLPRNHCDEGEPE